MTPVENQRIDLIHTLLEQGVDGGEMARNCFNTFPRRGETAEAPGPAAPSSVEAACEFAPHLLMPQHAAPTELDLLAIWLPFYKQVVPDGTTTRERSHEISRRSRLRMRTVTFLVAAMLCGQGAQSNGASIEALARFPYAATESTNFQIQVLRQDFEQLERNRSAVKTPLRIGDRRFERGLGTHSVSRLRVTSPVPLQKFSARIGIDNNERTEGRRGSADFSVMIDGREAFSSGVMRGGEAPRQIEVPLAGARAFELRVGDGGDGPGWDHADWAEARVVSQAGETFWLDQFAFTKPRFLGSKYPFSFHYGGKTSDQLLEGWKREHKTTATNAHRALTTTWTDPASGLKVTWEAKHYADYPALDWLLYFENTGLTDTPLLENIQAMDITLDTPLTEQEPYRLLRMKGAPSNPTDFEPATVVLATNAPAELGAGGGRSSNCDFPFFTIETGQGSWIMAVGWSGQWKARLASPDNHHLQCQAGMELTRFKLLPGERVRSPRILVFHWTGEPPECHAQFRQLIYRHYTATRSGEKLTPVLFCNTCFTRGGGWLNECNAENQISLIKVFGKLGLEALITDAGWFEGGWPAGAGNWTPRRDAYPQGMAPVAAAAQANKMVYGLWFEPERVVANTELHKQHPDWVLADGRARQSTLLADFGRKEVQDYFFNIVKGFMELPGFRFYRQDFNMDPLPYWRHHDTPDRQGITEIRYIEGLYAYWDRLAAAWPDSLREECASGGRRIDLETLQRMHLHQKSDYWFDNEVDQASLWSLSHYLPNHTISVPLSRLDDYSFHSTLAASLIPGWIADAPDFDLARAKILLDRYREVRPYLNGAWYPLLPYSRRASDWMGSQYHRPDLDAGMILLFRRAESPYRTVDAKVYGVSTNTTYTLRFDSTGETRSVSGKTLRAGYPFTIPEKQRSELIEYRRKAN